MNKVIVPEGYRPVLGSYDLQRAIALTKEIFQGKFTKNLHLQRVSAPLFVKEGSGLNDDLSGTERPVSFDIPAVNTDAQVVHSLAKWKRLALKRYEFHEGKGDIEDYVWTVSLAIELARLDESGQRAYDQLTDAEEKRAAEYRAFAWEFLEDTLQMNKEEITAFAASVLDDEGSVDDKKLKRNLEPRLRELGTIR